MKWQKRKAKLRDSLEKEAEQCVLLLAVIIEG